MIDVPNWGHVSERFLLGICCMVSPSIYCGNLGTHQQTYPFCDGKYLIALTFETSIQLVFKGFLWFFKLLYNTFQLFPGWIKNWMSKKCIHVCFNPFSLYLKINMDKTSSYKRQEPQTGWCRKKGWKKFYKKMKRNILNDAKEVADILLIQAMKLQALLTTLPQDQMILMFMALVLPYLPLAFVLFLHTTLSLKIKNQPTKNRINHLNDVICFRKNTQ